MSPLLNAEKLQKLPSAARPYGKTDLDVASDEGYLSLRQLGGEPHRKESKPLQGRLNDDGCHGKGRSRRRPRPDYSIARRRK